MRRAYERWAPIYDRSIAALIEAGRKDATEAINGLPGRTLLDVGVGTGLCLPDYATRFEVTGVDLSPAMLAQARRRVEREGLSHVRELREMDAGALDYPSGSFDLVVAAYVMTVVPDMGQVMGELERVCRPGGSIVIVNHFAEPGGLRGRVEKLMAQASKALGWHPDLRKEDLLAHTDLPLVEERRLKPLGLFSMLRLEKPAEV